ncbi:Uma2 family endonuclease [Microcoleus sp. FACHB-68]|uniref:Uma2 family endonuclease n=1 Tax=Microcoleus sp. FACHB-68 TaxID=2692826 RepID=UPI001684EEC1|nr:Uma2 family endonuclease [Microcoleus sp. FACHB-68]MBD1937038.1 Uma2 family endonuclease [Microcoleus sp. FACHB-68]
MIPTTAERLYTFAEYLVYDDGTDNRYELVEGKLTQMNPPTVKHLLIAKFIERVLDAEINRLGLPWLCLREAGVRTGYKKSRLMDVCVVPAELAMESRDHSAVFQLPPLLAVEIVSPESIKRDYRYKRSEYAALEIPEYWIADPIESKISVLILEEGLYEETVFTGTQQIVSQIFPELSLKVEPVLKYGNIGE